MKNTTLDVIGAIILLISSGITWRIILEIFGQNWIKTKAHTATLIILPIITYVITNVISGNIALSLGMVGALSIVRFRNPVRSPLELSVYFASITMGIAASVSVVWLIALNVSVLVAILCLVAASAVSQSIFKKSFFTASFSEGNSLSSLTISSNVQIDSLESHGLLQAKSFDKKNNLIIYYLSSSDFKMLKIIEQDKDIQLNSISIEIRR